MKHNTDRYTGCRIEVCDKTYYAKGLCKSHYYQAQRSGGYVPNSVVKPKTPAGADRRCTLPTCDRRHHANGLCHTHYTQEFRSVARQSRESLKKGLTNFR